MGSNVAGMNVLSPKPIIPKLAASPFNNFHELPEEYLSSRFPCNSAHYPSHRLISGGNAKPIIPKLAVSPFNKELPMDRELFKIVAILCPERYLDVYSGLVDIGISQSNIRTAEVWGGFAIQTRHIQNPNDLTLADVWGKFPNQKNCYFPKESMHGDFIHELFLPNRRIEIMAEKDQVRHVVKTMIRDSEITKLGDYKSFFVIPAFEGFCDDPPSCYKLQATIRPSPVLQSQFNKVMVRLAGSGVFISEVEDPGVLKPGTLGGALVMELLTFSFDKDHVNNFRIPMIMELLAERSQIDLVSKDIKLIGAESILWEPISDALVIRRGIGESGISDVRIYPGGKFDLKYDMDPPRPEIDLGDE